MASMSSYAGVEVREVHHGSGSDGFDVRTYLDRDVAGLGDERFALVDDGKRLGVVAGHRPAADNYPVLAHELSSSDRWSVDYLDARGRDAGSSFSVRSSRPRPVPGTGTLFGRGRDRERYRLRIYHPLERYENVRGWLSGELGRPVDPDASALVIYQPDLLQDDDVAALTDRVAASAYHLDVDPLTGDQTRG
ncbi:MAG: hypothetical protein SVU88_03985 [Candidatus Nanohaloarchaea archaeon]|nr:hypothetical protein [Candidatus Nanohaloarchaea archaeon]